MEVDFDDVVVGHWEEIIGRTSMDLEEALEYWQVMEPYTHTENDSVLANLYRVDDSNLTSVAYFSNANDAQRYRMFMIALSMNPLKDNTDV